MINKYEIETAIDLLKSYELAYRDKRRINHCISAEYLYKNSNVKENAFNETRQYKPEVLEMVSCSLRIMARQDRRALNILQIQFRLISPKYRPVKRTNSDHNRTDIYSKLRKQTRNKSKIWADQVNSSIEIFWQIIQKHSDFDKYFYIGGKSI